MELNLCDLEVQHLELQLFSVVVEMNILKLIKQFSLLFCKIEQSDPRVADWTLMTSPLPLICILSTYLLIIYRIGPS